MNCHQLLCFLFVCCDDGDDVSGVEVSGDEVMNCLVIKCPVVNW